MPDQDNHLVTLTRDGPVAILAIARGDGLNALSLAVLSQIRQHAEALRGDISVHAVILTGDPVFTAGADLKDPALARRAEAGLLERREMLRAGPDACEALAALDQVTIAAIEGFCIGGGVSLAVACDFRVASQTAHLRLPEIPLGMNMSWHTLPRLVALMGPAAAKRFTIFGQRWTAAEALAAGLICETVPEGEALARAKALALEAASLPPVAVRMTKRAISELAGALDRLGTYADLDQFALAASSEDYREAVAAFLGKRAPRFTGN
jgi:enoyl-CoA hydratase/carnithine racemase